MGRGIRSGCGSDVLASYREKVRGRDRAPSVASPVKRATVKRATVSVALCVTGALVTACGAPAARVEGARSAGEAFERALSAGDHEKACRLLAPETLRQLQEDERKPCAQVLGSEELPRAGQVHATEVYGRQAVLRLGGDTVFLSQFSGGWKVVAAGCTPQGEQPYQCKLKGG